MNYCWIELVFKEPETWSTTTGCRTCRLNYDGISLLRLMKLFYHLSCKTNCNVMHTAVRYNVIHGEEHILGQH